VLGVAPTASYGEARHAYMLRSQLLHPDRHQGAPTEVLAEADRAMRELNQAWEQVRASFGVHDAAPPPSAGRPEPPPDAARPPGGPPPPDGDGEPPSAGACLDWIVDRLVEAGHRHGDPLGWEEIVRLRQPIAVAPGGRRFDRWVERRRLTMRQAVADDAANGRGTDRWAQAWRVLGESRTTPVVMLLLDRR